MILCYNEKYGYHNYENVWEYDRFERLRLPESYHAITVDLCEIDNFDLNLNSVYLMTRYSEKINLDNILNDECSNYILDSSYNNISGFLLTKPASKDYCMYVESTNWIFVFSHYYKRDIIWFLFVVDSNTIKDLKLDNEKRNWKYLSTHIVKVCKILYYHRYDCVSIFNLIYNKFIFQEKKIDYESLKNKMDVIREDLMKECMHPKRLERHLEMGGDGDDF